jgi:hypothetical protein
MKIIALVICLAVLAMLAFGCAGTTDKVADAMNAFADAHETVQTASDSTRILCAMVTQEIKEEKALGEFIALCREWEDVFLKYKELSDPVIDALKKE